MIVGLVEMEYALLYVGKLISHVVVIVVYVEMVFALQLVVKILGIALLIARVVMVFAIFLLENHLLTVV